MRPPESFIGQPIRSLQTMLRVISRREDAQPTVIPDGVYTPETVRAVSAFQRRKGLPVTGITDQDTWEAIVAEYTDAIIYVGAPASIAVLLNPNQVLCAGERNCALFLAQGMLMTLSQAFRSVSPPGMSGTLDDATAESLRCFQSLCNHPVTGQLDRRTWAFLTRQYLLASRLMTNPGKS